MDVETVLDVDAAARAGFEDDGTFAPFPLHALACVSLLVVERDAQAKPVFSLHSFTRETLSERGIVAWVERALSDSFEVLTFNGRGFDVPVLMARAALAGEYAPTIGRLHMQRRNSAGIHVDLLEAVTAFGAAPKVSLRQLCSAFSIPCKLTADAGDVASLVAAGAWSGVANYCETDVIATYLASEIWQGAERGTSELAREAWHLLADWIGSNQPKLAHLQPYTDPPALPGGGAVLGAVDYRELGW